MLTHATYHSRAPGPHARPAPPLKERSTDLLGLASERNIMVPRGEDGKRDGLGGMSTMNTDSKQLHAIISLKDVAHCRGEPQQ